MSAIPQVILLRQVKSLTASINSYRNPTESSERQNYEETLLHVKDPPRVRGASNSLLEEDATEYRSYCLSVKAIRDDLPHDEDPGPNSPVAAPKNEGWQAPAPSATAIGTDREQERIENLLQVDPSCWIQMAEAGMYQRAEDTLTEASKVEFERNGITDRYCSLLHGIGALYDRRSYEDLTGQRNELSYQSAMFASQALAARRGLLAACQEAQPPSKEQAEWILKHKERLASSLALVGQSYCNFALDGASKRLTAKDALIKAEAHLREALAVREEMNHRELAEAEKGMGYLYYCRGSVLLQIPPDKRGPFEVEPGDNPESLYLRALPFYFRSLSLYIERDGELVETSVRMTCNVAQVYQHLSVSNTNYIEQAYQWYKLALERQEEAFGDGHQRTRRIKADLKDLEARKRAMEANQDHRVELMMSSRVAAEEAERAAEARKAEADQLMDQFLAGIREERKAAEQARRGQAKLPKQHSASEL